MVLRIRKKNDFLAQVHTYSILFPFTVVPAILLRVGFILSSPRLPSVNYAFNRTLVFLPKVGLEKD